MYVNKMRTEAKQQVKFQEHPVQWWEGLKNPQSKVKTCYYIICNLLFGGLGGYNSRTDC